MKEAVVHVENLRKIYHTKQGEVQAVKNVSFDIFREEIVGFIGPNGQERLYFEVSFRFVVSRWRDVNVLGFTTI
jgi:ABC-type lipopolysaccharide export system ATPase subunit